MSGEMYDADMSSTESEEYERMRETGLIVECLRAADDAKKDGKDKQRMISDEMIRQIASSNAKQKQDDEDLNLIFGNHTGLAQLYAKYNSYRVKMLSPKTGYIFNDRLLWEYVQHKEVFISDIGTQLQKLLKNKLQTITDPVQTKSICKIVVNCQYSSFLRSVSDFIYPYLNDQNFMIRLNSSPYEIPIKGGKIIDLRTKRIRNRLRTDYFDFEIDADYTPNQEHAKIFFNSIMCNKPDRVEYFKRVLGYSISADTKQQTIFILWGKGGNGKSALFYELIEPIFTKNLLTTTDKKVFIKPEFSSNSHTEHLVSLVGKRIAVFSETEEDDTLNEGQLKMITSGDEISARRIYGTEFKFKPVVKLYMLTNHKPTFKMNDSMLRRLVYIPFNAKFCDNPTKPNEFLKDPKLIENLRTKYKNEIFSWIIDGAYLYFQNESFGNPPKDFTDQKNEWYKDLDSVETYISENYNIIESSPTNKIKRGDLYESYKNYCKDEDVSNILGKKQFYATMTDKGHESHIYTGDYYYYTLKQK
jgi:putative DNA primase/helicase